MRFREIKTYREVERNFDPDKRITITSANNNTTTDFDPDKRIQPTQQTTQSEDKFDPDKRIKW